MLARSAVRDCSGSRFRESDSPALRGRHAAMTNWRKSSGQCNRVGSSDVRDTPDASQLANLPVDVPPPPPVNEADAPPDLCTACQQQIGLKLENTKAAVDGAVIDKVQKASAISRRGDTVTVWKL